MNHLSEEQQIELYYGEAAPETRVHLDSCRPCQVRFERLREVLDSVREFPVPQRGASYGAKVWTRLLPKLSVQKTRSIWVRWWFVAPVFATVLMLAFVAGMFIQQRRQIISPASRAQQRVLLMAISDHLERSDILLTQLLNSGDADERSEARDLVEENRLLRQTALHDGDALHAALLDDLERVLLDVANGPAHLSPYDLDALRKRVDNQGLLFKVRVTSTNAREKGMKL